MRTAALLPAACGAAAAVGVDWATAKARAAADLAALSAEDRLALVTGFGWTWDSSPEQDFYVGNVAGTARSPCLNMQDSGGGFRNDQKDPDGTAYGLGTVTTWPSAAAASATFDTDLVLRWAEALGDEFRAKGANVILGPSCNIHRVAVNGRNFEYLGGEDPYLASALVSAYVTGVQSKGVMAVAKHLALNSQEVHRKESSSDATERVIRQMYLPHFQAAVDAGVGAFMCAYNQINGTYSCDNEWLLTQVLRGDFGFEGFVMSDWWSEHTTTSTYRGLDQEQPGTPAHGQGPAWEGLPGPSIFWSAFLPNNFTEHRVARHVTDESARRVLAAMHKVGVFDPECCSQRPRGRGCRAQLAANVTSDAHAALAREIAEAGAVLLQNDGVLPLRAVRTVAVVGPAADSAPFQVMVPGEPWPHNNGPLPSVWNQGDYYSGGGSGHISAARVVTALAGIRESAARAGVAVVAAPGNDSAAAAAAARSADVVVFVGGTTSGEDMDRDDLALDDRFDAFVAATLQAAPKPSVVVSMVPGPVLTPWRGSVNAAVTMWLSGQEAGRALGAVLFGEVNPSGRLPESFPAAAADAVPHTVAEPGCLAITEKCGAVPYVEGLRLGYRDPARQLAFPFGHGLSYTQFAYSNASARRCVWDECAYDVSVRVANAGSVAGAEVAQLYLTFDAAESHGEPQALKGFRKTKVLHPGEVEEVRFTLTDRDLSVWLDRGQRDGWARMRQVTAHVGASSRDLRAAVPLS